MSGRQFAAHIAPAVRFTSEIDPLGEHTANCAMAQVHNSCVVRRSDFDLIPEAELRVQLGKHIARTLQLTTAGVRGRGQSVYS